jgi:hypothetical protein
MRKGFLTSSIAMAAVLAIGMPSAPEAFAMPTYAGAPQGAVVQVNATPTASNLGNSVGKSSDIKSLGKKTRRRGTR